MSSFDLPNGTALGDLGLLDGLVVDDPYSLDGSKTQSLSILGIMGSRCSIGFFKRFSCLETCSDEVPYLVPRQFSAYRHLWIPS